jgi:uncharacterized membrane-anchored protein
MNVKETEEIKIIFEETQQVVLIESYLKGIVQRKLTGVETRLK